MKYDKNQKGTPKLLKKINSSIIINHIKNQKEGISKAQISRNVSISEPTVSKIVKELISKKVLANKGKGETSLGRKPDMVFLNNDYGKIVCIDLGLEKTSIVIINLYGEIIEKKKFKIIGLNDEERLDSVVQHIEEFKNKHCCDGQKLIMAIIGIPGIIDINLGNISYAHTFTSWKDFPIKETLERKLKTRVFIDNDVNLDALGEMTYGFKKKPSNLLFVAWSKGFAAGIILNGSIFRGHSGAAGEIGYSIISEKGMKYTIPETGYPGYLESIIYPTSLINTAIIYSKKIQKVGFLK